MATELTPEDALEFLVSEHRYPQGDHDAYAVIEVALERARVVGVLDAWAEDRGLSWTCSPADEGRPVQCTLEDEASTFEHFEGATPDAARAAAAKAIEEGSV